VETQAEMGWDSQVFNGSMPVFAARFWFYPSKGAVVERARAYALEDTNDWHQESYAGNPFTNEPRRFGDPLTRLKFVYSGADDIDPRAPIPAPKPWYRVISEGS
jgi:hypothetical protein